jgi:hypothetical protein
MSTPAPFPLFKNLVPFVISSAQRRTGGKWQALTNDTVRNGDYLQMQGAPVVLPSNPPATGKKPPGSVIPNVRQENNAPRIQRQKIPESF